MVNLRFNSICFISASALLLLFSVTLSAEPPPLPQHSEDLHLGVVTCAGSTCHGATRPFQDSNVLQNEYVTWHRDDSHSKAYQVLLNEQSRRIARNLGLEAAHTAAICLDCHADNVPAERRGERFELSDGVGCEACHGGAERWLGPHTSGRNSHQDNLELGLYPTEEPAARAKLCLSCHLGDQTKLVTHRIMGAGHPRLSFELDTFTDIQPPHYVIDADYRERKQVWPGAQVWAVGQFKAADRLLTLLQSPVHSQPGLFPELFFYDCHACHHSFNQPNWTPRQTTGLGPGQVRLNDAHLLMIKHIVQHLAPAQAKTFAQAVRALHQATTESMAATRQAARRLQTLLDNLQDQLLERPFTAEDMRTIARALVAEGLRGEHSDYAAAEQSTMALASIINSMALAGALDESQSEALTAALDKIYTALADEDRYQPQRYVAALKSLQGVLPG